MSDERPDPDALLEKVRLEAARAARGRLKIFFGAAAGVGKTYAMLQAAQARRAEGVDVVVGYVEGHQRPETNALLTGLEQMPTRRVVREGATLAQNVREFDIDAALARRPTLILVDELAHTNAAGSRHPKRHRDIEDLLEAGIDVYTTVNVQHLESLNDVIEQVTGVRVRETVPDSLIEAADEVELIDLPPDELLARLREGKIYLPGQAQQAVANFFRKGNLLALRELALRSTADRVDQQVRSYREDNAIEDAWPVRERILVCLVPGPFGEKLVRSAKRLASLLRAPWIGVHVETPRNLDASPAERESVLRTLRLAESLGAETITLTGEAEFSDDLLEFARARNVTRILLGKPTRTGWRRWLFGSVVDSLVAASDDIEVHVVGGEPTPAPGTQPFLARSTQYLGLEPPSAAAQQSPRRRWAGFGWAVVATVGSSLVAWPMWSLLDFTTVEMIYLLGVVVVAVYCGRWPSIVAAILGVLAFNLIFVPPYWTFAVDDPRYIVTFGVMLVLGLVISSLTASVRRQARVAGHRERRTAALYAMTRELAAIRDRDAMLDRAVHHVSEVFDAQAVVLLPDAARHLEHPRALSLSGSLRGADLSIGQWVLDHSRMAGLGTDTLAGTDTLFLPLAGSAGTVGVLALLPADARRTLSPEQLHLLETFASQIAVALEREQLTLEARDAELKASTERLRNALLAAISHDMRTPLSVVAGAASTLAESEGRLDPVARRELAESIVDQAHRMTRLIENILRMTRLESGSVELDRQWYPLEELIGSVLTRLRGPIGERAIEVDLAQARGLVELDGVLFEEVLANLLENALRYTPAGSPIRLHASTTDSTVTLVVEDRGPGFPPGDEERVFEKF
ncbi:MAG: sensor histidine kinase KdpD, partial [Proteobacteria bacterium]|nr:sensor histidine kinase KdpD [Burkholderiales bacterium]